MKDPVETILTVSSNKVKEYLSKGKINEARIINDFTTELLYEFEKPEPEPDTVLYPDLRAGDYITTDIDCDKTALLEKDIANIKGLYRVNMIANINPNIIIVDAIKYEGKRAHFQGRFNLLNKPIKIVTLSRAAERLITWKENI